MEGCDKKALLDYEVKTTCWTCSKRQKLQLIVLGFALFTFVMVGGYLLAGKYTKQRKDVTDNPSSTAHDKIVRSIKAENIRENLRYLTRLPHTAGTFRNYQLAVHLKRFYENAGFDRVEIAQYDVLLPHPKEPGQISIRNKESGDVIFETHVKEKPLWEGEDSPDVIHPFAAYSPPGTVQGKTVYINYGTAEDFKALQKMGVNLTGCIAIARYGMNFRGNKVELAKEAGAVGVLLYSDPIDYAQGDRTFPQSWWLPEDGVQRGDIRSVGEGDILTPGYPSVDGMYRLPLAKALKAFSIPVQPISYHDAFHVLRQIDGIKAPESWQGGLNITYKITTSGKNPREIKLVVNTEFKRVKIYNVIATLEGKIEPDRVVLLGNHYDAWVFGGCDPSSGTAVMMEIGRVLGEAKMSGWRPRRTIKVCAWDAEEFGIIGSTEWVEENANFLLYEAVAYINVDNAVSGNYTVLARASAQIPNLLFHAAQKVKDPDEKGSSLLETWRRKSPDPEDKQKPSVFLPSSGSDYKAFFTRMAVPVLDLKYTFDEVKYKNLSSFPMYHSLHDSFHFVETFVDQGFRHHSTIAALALQAGLSIADEPIIPFNFSSYAAILQACYKSSIIYEPFLVKRNISLKPLKDAVEMFARSARHFHHVIDALQFKNDLHRRMVNDKIMHIGRAFIAPEGLPGRPYERHVIYSQSSLDTYAGSCFPGLVDGISNSLKERKSDWTVPAQQMSKIIYHIRQATKLLSI